MNDGKKSVSKNYVYNLIYQILSIIVPLVTTPYVSRVLMPEGMGAFSYTTAITGYFVLFANLGVATYGQLKIAANREDKQALSKIFYELFCLRFLLTVLTTGVYVLFLYTFAEPQYQQLYLVLIIQIAAAVFDISWLLQGLEEFQTIVVRNIVIRLLSVACIFLFVKKAEDLYLYAVIVNGATLLGNLSIYAFLPKTVVKVPWKELDLLQHLKPCLEYFIPTIATTLYLTLDKVMIGWFTETDLENGYYEQAHKIEQMAVLAVTSLSMVIMPRMAYLFKNKQTEEIQKTMDSSMQFILLLSIPMAFGLCAVADYFIPLFLGDGYEKSAILLKIFSVLIIFVGLNNGVGKQVLMAIGRQKEYNKGVLAGTAVNVVLNSALIPFFSSVGAAVASVMAELTVLIVFLLYAKDYVKVSFILKKSVKYLIAGGVMLGAILLSYTFLDQSWTSVALQVTAGVVIYFAVLLCLRDDLTLGGVKTVVKKITKKK